MLAIKADSSRHPVASEEVTTYEESREEIWNMTEERAPFQVNLQRRTSELTLSSAPPVETMTQLQISAEKAAARAEADRRRDKDNQDVLNFVEDILKAHIGQGKIYNGFTGEEKRAFNEAINVAPPEERVDWLANKLMMTENLTYEIFLNTLCFVHSEVIPGDPRRRRRYTLNYVHQKHVLPGNISLN